ncbi:MAG: hypothetical protein B6I20_00215 [Bacteroidetes bacterium 4572_117]|nr:MAG: hypothetical protein B6I20_00215 [Bacteroidetes bacterium 4572_117]
MVSDSKEMNFLTRLFLNDSLILSLIIINSITIFSEGFSEFGEDLLFWINLIDSVVTILFLFEAIIKINHFSWRAYIDSNWNKLDFFLVVLSLPSIFLLILHSEHHGLSFLLIFRISRVFKFFRFFKFIPGIEALVSGVQRAMKASVFVLFGFFVFNFIIAILSSYLFKDISPEYFGNPLKSMYSVFKVFTIEGWYEIPDKLSTNAGNITAFLIKSYFVLVLIIGGIIGLSLVNSIFVDSMVMDNTDELERKVDVLNKKVDFLVDTINNKDKSSL